MPYSEAFYRDQGQARQKLEPIAGEAETPEIDAVLQSVVYLQLEVATGMIIILPEERLLRFCNVLY